MIPHATIGVGIFMAASLHAAATLPHCPYHEYQHSVFDRNLAVRRHDDALRTRLLRRCPTGPGLGVTPRPESLCPGHRIAARVHGGYCFTAPDVSPADEERLEQQEQHEHRQQRHDAGGHQRRPLDQVLADERLQAHGDEPVVGLA